MNDGHQGESEIGSVEEAKVQSVLCRVLTASEEAVVELTLFSMRFVSSSRS